MDSGVQKEDDCILLFEQLLEEIQDYGKYQQALQSFLQKHDLDRIGHLRLNDVRKIHALIAKNRDQRREQWVQSEKKIFLWVLACYMHCRSITRVEQLTFQDYNKLARALSKDSDFLRFQANSFLGEPRGRMWQKQEDLLLREIIIQCKRDINGGWRPIAKELFLRSGNHYLRTSKQCRERWQNHLDANKVKGNWDPSQDMVILKIVKEKGKKWAFIASELKGQKNEHMVKNRYNSLLRKKKNAVRLRDQKQYLKALIQDKVQEVLQRKLLKEEEFMHQPTKRGQASKATMNILEESLPEDKKKDFEKSEGLLTHEQKQETSQEDKQNNMLKDIVLDSRQDLPELENKSIVVSQRPDYRKTNSQACRSEKDVMDMFCEEDFPNQQILEEGRRSVNFDYGYREFSEGFFKEMRNFTPQPPHFDNHCDRASVGFMPFGPSPCLYNSVSNCTPGNVEYRNDFAACYNVGIKEIQKNAKISDGSGGSRKSGGSLAQLGSIGSVGSMISGGSGLSRISGPSWASRALGSSGPSVISGQSEGSGASKGSK